ncbi:hypothetical protein [Mammaliicoccus stepanovicii]|uniref:Uncharacterized protein n=1 Tax=Mammaliicoccus stepanovicii TaxID=643214 RepID=A0A239YAN5_9STAP|nr:hypothetical protein [Mammaliicoccus stepanovicii]PNZ75478.1 hypothetical protein CD111_07305 [Mammaliicoccus stepanovicii]GGI43089.1 hypothetical protein GCM10010896_21700 [Mammaliicoccus stepanovicii]SNV55927.1 Uncharacterised protein [Mammaliicoccus stepanovicii]
MTVHGKKLIKVNRLNEGRSSGISVMIEEGGLGADSYYQIIKQNSDQEETMEDIFQFEKEVQSKGNQELIDLLIINAQQHTGQYYKEALNIIKAELLSRM